MRYKQFQNENTGLSFYDQSMDVMSGVSALSTMGADTAKFKIVSGSLYASVFAELPFAKKAVITTSLSYISDMLRAYMRKVSTDRIAYQPAKYDSYWLPYFVNQGFDSEVTKVFFAKFSQLNSKGVIPRDIWFPAANTPIPDTVTDTVVEKSMSTATIALIVAGGIGVIGAGYLALK